MITQRQSGILLHITSLPNRYGIGDMGQSAYAFVDFLEESGQTVWQILPLGPTDYYGSPYMPYSAFAGNPNLISPEGLAADGLIPDLKKETFWEEDLQIWKDQLLNQAAQNFFAEPCPDLEKDFHEFISANSFWLPDYALFMALKEHFHQETWIQWPTDLAQGNPEVRESWRQELAAPIKDHQFIQFIFHRQWQGLRQYAAQKGIAIIGDLPAFVAYNSADVWANPQLFLVDKEKKPTGVAGVPPDYFSKTGQLWGNPLYNWEAHAEENYTWWIRRIRNLLKYVDKIRIDHFRSFESYWQVPFGEKTAIRGSWQPGPGSSFFQAVKTDLGALPFIAEDLGLIDEKVIDLRDRWNLPGMRVLQFAFNNLQPNHHSPHEHTKNSVVYTGTHDNDTTQGWYSKAGRRVQSYTQKYIGTEGTDIAWDFIRLALASPGILAVIPLQDILALDSSARMNTPGTSTGNWLWRYGQSALDHRCAEKLRDLTALYGREPKNILEFEFDRAQKQV